MKKLVPMTTVRDWHQNSEPCSVLSRWRRHKPGNHVRAALLLAKQRAPLGAYKNFARAYPLRGLFK